MDKDRWTLPEALAWIMWRDLSEIGILEGKWPPVVIEYPSRKTKGPSVADNNELFDETASKTGTKPYFSEGDAFRVLFDGLESGSIRAKGRRNPTSKHEPIEPSDFKLAAVGRTPDNMVWIVSRRGDWFDVTVSREKLVAIYRARRDRFKDRWDPQDFASPFDAGSSWIGLSEVIYWVVSDGHRRDTSQLLESPFELETVFDSQIHDQWAKAEREVFDKLETGQLTARGLNPHDIPEDIPSEIFGHADGRGTMVWWFQPDPDFQGNLVRTWLMNATSVSPHWHHIRCDKNLVAKLWPYGKQLRVSTAKSGFDAKFSSRGKKQQAIHNAVMSLWPKGVPEGMMVQTRDYRIVKQIRGTDPHLVPSDKTIRRYFKRMEP